MRNRKAIRLRPSQGGAMRIYSPPADVVDEVRRADVREIDTRALYDEVVRLRALRETQRRYLSESLAEHISPLAPDCTPLNSQVMGRSRRDGRSYFIPSPGNAPVGWQTLDEKLFCDAGDGDVALVSRIDMHGRVLLCKFYHPTGKCRTPPMTVYEDETTGWRELTPVEVRSFREKIAKAHGEAYEHAI